MRFKKKVKNKLYLQKREENDSFDAQEFPDRIHRSQGFSMGSVKENQVVHGDKLGKIVDRNHVRVSHIWQKFAFGVDASYLTYPIYCKESYSYIFYDLNSSKKVNNTELTRKRMQKEVEQWCTEEFRAYIYGPIHYINIRRKKSMSTSNLFIKEMHKVSYLPIGHGFRQHKGKM